MDVVINLLQFLGLTPDKSPFLALGILMLAGFVYTSRLSDAKFQRIDSKFDLMDKKIERMGTRLGKVRDNMLIIVSYLVIDRK